MLTLLLLCVLAAALWLASSLRGGSTRSKPTDSVAAYNRALRAIAPEREQHPRVAAPRRRPHAAGSRPRARRAAPASRQRARRAAPAGARNAPPHR